MTISRGGDRRFEMKLLDVDNGIISIPKQRYEFTASAPSAEFHRICRDLKDIGSTVRISATADSVTVAVEGDDMVGKATRGTPSKESNLYKMAGTWSNIHPTLTCRVECAFLACVHVYRRAPAPAPSRTLNWIHSS